MSITDKIPVKAHIEVLNEILSIQKATILIASNGIKHKVTIPKNDVDSFTLDYLSAYFQTPIKGIGLDIWISINCDNCTINVSLKQHKKEVSNEHGK
jgi:hypothetical protein